MTETDLSLPLVKFDNPVLREQMPRFDFSNPPDDPIYLANVLASSLIKHGGYGIAAPQLGLRYNAFAMKGQPILVFFNPKIVAYSDETELLEEGCLSFPGFVIKRRRSNAIRCRFTLPNGQTETRKFIGLTARVVQHECDHLQGKLFFDGCSRLTLEKAIKDAKKNGYHYNMKDFKQ